jgi:hypothetical protein
MYAASSFRKCQFYRIPIAEKLNIAQNFSSDITCNMLIHYEVIRIIWRQTVVFFVRILRNTSAARAECKISNDEAHGTCSYHCVVKCERCNMREMFVFRMCIIY